MKVNIGVGGTTGVVVFAVVFAVMFVVVFVVVFCKYLENELVFDPLKNLNLDDFGASFKMHIVLLLKAFPGANIFAKLFVQTIHAGFTFVEVATGF